MPSLATALPAPALHLLPGSTLVLFLVSLDQACPVLAVAPRHFLEGLRTAADLLGFHGLQRADDQLDELLPWAGGV